jgi:hypothetical protein
VPALRAHQPGKFTQLACAVRTRQAQHPEASTTGGRGGGCRRKLGRVSGAPLHALQGTGCAGGGHGRWTLAEIGCFGGWVAIQIG